MFVNKCSHMNGYTLMHTCNDGQNRWLKTKSKSKKSELNPMSNQKKTKKKLAAFNLLKNLKIADGGFLSSSLVF